MRWRHVGMLLAFVVRSIGWRHVVRILVLAVIAALILLNDYFSLKGQFGGQKMIDESWLYSIVDDWFGRSRHLKPYETFAQGGLWSFSIYSFRISDPLAVLSAPEALALTATIPIVATMLLGRVFCGWICPMGLLSEIVTGIRRGLERMGVAFFSWPVSNLLKYAVLAIGLLFALAMSVSFFFPIYPPRIISDILRDSLLSSPPIGGIVFIGVILLAELLFVERLWCRCLCPGGAVYSILGKSRFLRIRRNLTACNNCGDCDKVCPHDLKPASVEPSGECDNCGLCKNACEPKALHYTLKKPWGRDDK
jgi:ferredoxin-type protein NapH